MGFSYRECSGTLPGKGLGKRKHLSNLYQKGEAGMRCSGLSGIVLLSFVLYMPTPATGWVDLGWGLQGAISLAGDINALGPVLKHAEVEGAAGL